MLSTTTRTASCADWLALPALVTAAFCACQPVDELPRDTTQGVVALHHPTNLTPTGEELSIEHNSTRDSKLVRGDWDLRFGRDPDSDTDVFIVRFNPDDSSFIVDLGPVTLEDVPQTIQPDDYPTGLWGTHDHQPVIAGHTYVVRTADMDTRLYAVIQVVAHWDARKVVIRWKLSQEPDRIVFSEILTPHTGVYFHDTLESGTNISQNWTLHGDWEWGTPRGIGGEPDAAEDGLTCLGTGMGRSYTDGDGQFGNIAISPVIDLRTAVDPVLVFSLWLDLSDDYDDLSLWARRSPSSSWHQLYSHSFPYNTINTWDYSFHWNRDPDGPHWRRVTVDLFEFAGGHCQIGWALANHGPGEGTGAYVDSVSVAERTELIP